MSGRRLRSSNPSSTNEKPTECMTNQSLQQFKHGDILWSRINGGSWWPVQVVDEICVACKPKKIKNDQILVRLYGTFEHMYVEPVNCVSKIEIFGQENSSNREIFQKFLEEDLIHMKSGGQSAATVSESKEISEIEKEKEEAPTRGKGQIKGKLKRTMITDNSPPAGSSDNPKAAKKVKGVMSEGMEAVKASEVGITKRRTRSETFKARNEGTSRIEIEVSNETGNVDSGVSTISSFDKNDPRHSAPKGEGVATGARWSRHRRTNGDGTSLEKASESNCVKQECGRNPDENKNAQIEYLDAKEIKKLVAKIVKEVAEKSRNDALKGKGMERCPENSEYIDSSRKKFSEIKKRKLHIPRRVKNKDIEAHITGAIDDNQDKTAGPSDVGKPNGADKLNNGASLHKIRYSDRDRNERTKDAGIEMPNAAERANNEIQEEINGARWRRLTGCSNEMDGGEKSQSNFAKRDEAAATKPGKTKEAMNGKIVKQDVSREKMNGPTSTTKCFLSPRCRRVMQSLGLIAPLGSPFCRNGLIRSLLP